MTVVYLVSRPGRSLHLTYWARPGGFRPLCNQFIPKWNFKGGRATLTEHGDSEFDRLRAAGACHRCAEISDQHHDALKLLADLPQRR